MSDKMAEEFSRSEGIEREVRAEVSSDRNFVIDRSSLQFEMELLAALLEPEDAPYPWNIADPESEAYFTERERELMQAGWSEEETVSDQTFFSALDTLWSTVVPSKASNNISDIANEESAIRASLQQQFAACVPQGWIEAIAHRAQQAVSAQKELAQQLVECVQDLVPSWTEADLLVLARPFAYAMRSTEAETVDFVLEKVRRCSWTELNEIEQAKTSLAIARYALSQLQAMRDEG